MFRRSARRASACHGREDRYLPRCRGGRRDPRTDPPGLSSTSRPLLVGILNITEDSFSDGGRYLDPAAALAQARCLVAGGADIVELGAAASNIAAKTVAAAEEIRRLDPVIAALEADGVPVSIDTYQPETQRFALTRDVAYLNDIQGFPDAAIYPDLAAAS